MNFYYKGSKYSTGGGASSDVTVSENGLLFSTIATDDSHETIGENVYYTEDGTQKTNTAFDNALVEYDSAMVYRYSGRTVNIPPVVFLNSSKAFISSTAESATSYVDWDENSTASDKPITLAAGNLLSEDCVSIPDGTAYLLFQYYTGNGVDSFKVESASITTETMKTEKAVNDLYYKQKTRLSGQEVLFFGDSIGYGVGSNRLGKSYGFAEAVHNILPDVYCYNYCIGGAYFKYKETDSPNRIITQVDTAYAEHPNAKYIVLEGGFNDGDYTSGYPDNDEYDYADLTAVNTTLWGGMEECISYIMDKFPDAKILFATSHWVKAQSATEATAYMDGVKHVCQKWAIPLCDNYYELGYSTKKTEVQLHPPAYFHDKYLAPRIANALVYYFG